MFLKLLLVMIAATAVSPVSAQEVDRRVLEKREIGNPGGAHYGEFGPPDAYENGSVHPFYGAENQWSRRMFSKRASDLYYKRRGQRQMLGILDGAPDKALALADARLAVGPDDAESLFLKTVALTRLNDLKGAWTMMESALRAGLPFGRFLAGPRDLLLPLVTSAKFQALAAAKNISILHGPMLGNVTQHSARFWVRTARETRFEIRVNHGPSHYIASGVTSKKDNYTGIAHVKGLEPDTKYSYQVYVDGVNQSRDKTYIFKTSPPPSSPGKFMIGFGGCAGYTPTHERMWDTLAGHDMQAFLFLGDNVYIDMPTMPGAFHEYTYYRRQSRPEFRRFVSSTPVYAIWDDHDAGFDDIWMGPYVNRPAWKQPLVQFFRQNWVNPAYGSETAPGTWFGFSHGDVDIFMLDGRTYRTNPFIKNRTMLGAEQKMWLLDGLKNSTATFKIIASPVGWADGEKPGSRDTWSGFGQEREEILSFIEQNNVEGVVLLSSDRHRSEAWKIKRDSGYAFYDLESGQLTNIHTHPLEKGALFSYNLKNSFGLLSFDTTRADPEVTYQIYSIDNELINTLVIKRSELVTGGSKNNAVEK